MISPRLLIALILWAPLLQNARAFEERLSPGEVTLLTEATNALRRSSANRVVVRPVPEEGVYARYPRARLSHWDKEAGDATILFPGEAEFIFKRLAALPHIPFRYVEDGCYARAHEMNRILELHGIASVKIYVFADIIEEALTIPNDPQGRRWRFHVAPVILVRRGGSIESAVLDPSIFDRPVGPEEWIGSMIRHNPQLRPHLDVFYRHRRDYNYDHARSSDFRDPGRFEPRDFDESISVLNDYQRELERQAESSSRK